jgi:hypothetical protein
VWTPSEAPRFSERAVAAVRSCEEVTVQGKRRPCRPVGHTRALVCTLSPGSVSRLSTPGSPYRVSSPATGVHPKYRVFRLSMPGSPDRVGFAAWGVCPKYRVARLFMPWSPRHRVSVPAVGMRTCETRSSRADCARRAEYRAWLAVPAANASIAASLTSVGVALQLWLSWSYLAGGGPRTSHS